MFRISANRRRIAPLLAGLLVLVVGAARGGDDALAEQRAGLPLDQIPGLVLPPAAPSTSLQDLPALRKKYEAAFDLYEDKSYDRCAAVLEGMLESSDAESYEVLSLLALAEFRLARFAEARAAAEYAARLRPTAADMHYLLGCIYRQGGESAPAVGHFRTATLAAPEEVNNPRITAAWFELGALLNELGYRSAAAEALANFDRAIWETHTEHRLDPDVAALLETHPYAALELRRELLAALGRGSELIPTAELAVRTRPDDPYLSRLYVRVLLDAGQAPQALNYCRAALAGEASPAASRRSQNAATLLSLALEAARIAGRLDEWVEQTSADVAAGHGAELAAAMARRLDEAGQHAAAVRLWTALLTSDPGSADYAWALANSQRDGGRFDDAFETLVQFVRANPDSAEIPRERLEHWMRRLDATEEFLRLTKRWALRTDRDFATYFVLGSLAAAGGQGELAENTLFHALKERPNFALGELAWAQMRLGAYRWEEAKTHARNALKLNPRLAAAHFLMGLAHAGLDENDEATDALKQAVELRPRDAQYALALGRHLRRVGDYLGAQRYLQDALGDDPGNGLAMEELIETYLGADKIALAEAEFADAEQSDVPDDSLRRVRTTLRYRKALFGEEHLAELRKQCEQYPDDWQTPLKLAAGLYLRGDPDAALPHVQRALALRPDSEEALFLLARVQSSRLEFGAATTAAEALAARFPNRRAAVQMLVDYYHYDFRPEEARRVLRQRLSAAGSASLRAAIANELLESFLTFQDYDAALEFVDAWKPEEATDDEDEPEFDAQRGRMLTLLLADRGEEAFAIARQRLSEIQPGSHFVYKQFRRRQDLVRFGQQAKQCVPLEAEIRRWRQDDVEQPLYVAWLAETLLVDKRPVAALEAIETFSLTAARVPEDLRILRARCLAAMDRVDDAARELAALADERGISGDVERRARVRIELVQLLARARRYDEALRACEKWASQAAGTPERLMELESRRYVLQAAGRTDEYVKTSQELLELTPDDIGINNDLGYTWTDRGEHLERAFAMIRRAVAADPLNAAYLDSLGWAHYKRGDFAAAREQLGRAARLPAGRDPVVRDHLGDAEWRLGNRDAAEKTWRSALELAEQEPREESALDRAALIAALRAKLAAAQQGTPAVAPTAAEPKGGE